MTRYLQQNTLFGPQLRRPPAYGLGMVVVIPAYDEPYLLHSLLALKRCQSPGVAVDVIVVINYPESASTDLKQRSQAQAEELEQWAKANSQPHFRFSILLMGDLPDKSAGVGLARKIGMDEACWQLERAKAPDGIIACFDADSRCDPNYLVAIAEHFQHHPNIDACSVHYEHPLTGADFEEEVYTAITEYELHLRYFELIQRWAGFPLAIQTVGSSMAVRAKAYQAQGGMPRRQAGEDFYFLHKFTQVGRHNNCLTTRVIPSARPSFRVPFGTGRAIQDSLREKQSRTTYAPAIFMAIQPFLRQVDRLADCQPEQLDAYLAAFDPLVASFFAAQNLAEKLPELQRQTGKRQDFTTRFFQWFNAFRMMKYVHYARDEAHPNVPIAEATAFLCEQLGLSVEKTAKAQLLALRGYYVSGA